MLDDAAAASSRAELSTLCETYVAQPQCNPTRVNWSSGSADSDEDSSMADDLADELFVGFEQGVLWWHHGCTSPLDP